MTTFNWLKLGQICKTKILWEFAPPSPVLSLFPGAARSRPKSSWSLIVNSSSFGSFLSHLLSFFLPFLFSSLLYSFLLGELERDLSLSYLSTKSWYDGIMMINSITSPVPSFCHRFFLDLFLHLSGLPQVAWVQQRLKTRSKWIQLQNETMQRFHSV